MPLQHFSTLSKHSAHINSKVPRLTEFSLRFVSMSSAAVVLAWLLRLTLLVIYIAVYMSSLTPIRAVQALSGENKSAMDSIAASLIHERKQDYVDEGSDKQREHLNLHLREKPIE